eukprot:CAMPEP_0182599856 /NCGR_PEP_ID=MMETSP1324-20130603/90692_1 /TAXON_ID=236786 /ORGANISM="Florenciella sp., Strain RCC1587" /LENGTH=305 /DNA_ID=CAMNT_0024817761 /DNA_START=295 /DNA_END=1212 /DNA_ORIENTATION=-
MSFRCDQTDHFNHFSPGAAIPDLNNHMGHTGGGYLVSSMQTLYWADDMHSESPEATMADTAVCITGGFRSFRVTSAALMKYLIDAGGEPADVFMISSVAREVGTLSWNKGVLAAVQPDLLEESRFTRAQLGSRLKHLDLANYTTFCPAQLMSSSKCCTHWLSQQGFDFTKVGGPFSFLTALECFERMHRWETLRGKPYARVIKTRPDIKFHKEYPRSERTETFLFRDILWDIHRRDFPLVKQLLDQVVAPCAGKGHPEQQIHRLINEDGPYRNLSANWDYGHSISTDWWTIMRRNISTPGNHQIS